MAADSDPLRTRLKRRGIDLICPHRRNRTKPPTQDGRYDIEHTATCGGLGTDREINPGIFRRSAYQLACGSRTAFRGHVEATLWQLAHGPAPLIVCLCGDGEAED